MRNWAQTKALELQIKEKPMKKIVLLEGSPRINGNSSMLCDEFMRGAREAGHEAEKLLLSKKRIGGCFECNACYI